MRDQTKKYIGLSISEGYVSRLEKRIAELERINEVWRKDFAKLEAENKRMEREVKHATQYGDSLWAENRRLREIVREAGRRFKRLDAENKRMRELLIENWTDEVELLEAALQEDE